LNEQKGARHENGKRVDTWEITIEDVSLMVPHYMVKDKINDRNIKIRFLPRSKYILDISVN
jgi:hypothetical protein